MNYRLTYNERDLDHIINVTHIDIIYINVIMHAINTYNIGRLNMSLAATQNFVYHTMQQAYIFHTQGDLSKAEKLYKQVLKKDPRHADANRFLALIAHKFGFHSSALQLITRSISADPNQAQSHYIQALLLDQIRNQDEATKSYKRCLRLQPQHKEALNNLGLIYKKNYQFEEAISCYEIALQYHPDCAITWANLGNVLKETGKMEEAITALEKSVSIDKSFHSAYSNLLLTLNYCSGIAPKYIYKMHKAWETHCTNSLKANRFSFKGRKEKQ